MSFFHCRLGFSFPKRLLARSLWRGHKGGFCPRPTPAGRLGTSVKSSHLSSPPRLVSRSLRAPLILLSRFPNCFNSQYRALPPSDEQTELPIKLTFGF